MDIENAGQLGTIDDVTNNIQLFYMLIQSVMPIIITLISIAIIMIIVAKIKYYKKQKEKEKKIRKEIEDKKKKRKKRIKTLYKDDEFMLKQLNNTETKQPDNIEQYRSLDITFGKDGKPI